MGPDDRKRADAEDEDGDPSLPRALWDRLRSDPVRAPEHLALAAARSHGPAAAAWAERERPARAGDTRELARAAKQHHARLARYAGAAGGVGGAATVLPDIAALAWIQSRMVFHIAAALEHDPLHRMRPAELLVLQGFFAEVHEARRALDGAGRTVAGVYISRSLSGAGQRTLSSKLMRAVGRRTVRRVGFRSIPVLAMGVNAAANERDTRALAERTIEFYAA